VTALEPGGLRSALDSSELAQPDNEPNIATATAAKLLHAALRVTCISAFLGAWNLNPNIAARLPLTTWILGRQDWLCLRRLTFDMRGGRKQAKLACGRPLDGRVRALLPWWRLHPRLPMGR